MKRLLLLAAIPLTLPLPGAEATRYSINWPSGLSLGEAVLEVQTSNGETKHSFVLEASIPGFAVADRFAARATPDRCSIELDKQFAHGKRRGQETTQFRSAEGVAERRTKDGGTSSLPIPPCARDALTYLDWLRAELQQGRLPGPQTIYFGAPYRITLKFAGTQPVTYSGATVVADRLEAVVQGPASENRFQLFFSRDAARKLLMARVPFALGSFTMEIAEE